MPNNGYNGNHHYPSLILVARMRHSQDSAHMGTNTGTHQPMVIVSPYEWVDDPTLYLGESPHIVIIAHLQL